TTMAVMGIPSAIEPRAIARGLNCLGWRAGGAGAGCGATGRTAAWASLASTRASMSRPTRSTKEASTPSPDSVPSSLLVSQAARPGTTENGSHHHGRPGAMETRRPEGCVTHANWFSGIARPEKASRPCRSHDTPGRMLVNRGPCLYRASREHAHVGACAAAARPDWPEFREG